VDAIEERRERDRRVSETVARERPRLWNFIRSRVPDPREAEDILQDVFYELAEANRLLIPIEHVTGWLFRVARNRIVDLFRKRRPERLADVVAVPEALHMRRVVLEEIERALAELPPEQREVFVAHELEGRSFKDLAAESGVNLNTLLARKRYAVLQLRKRLQELYEEMDDV
jgi:RNA polymerase sigma factor (sigma-70 family)